MKSKRGPSVPRTSGTPKETFLEALFGDAKAQARVLANCELEPDWDTRVRLAKTMVRWMDEQAEELRRYYFAETTDPMMVWETWQRCRKESKPLPEWAASEFDRWATNLSALAKLPPKRDVPGDAGRALGFGPKKKAAGPFSARQKYNKKRQLILAYCAERARGSDDKAAIREVVNAHHVGERTLERALQGKVDRGAVSPSYPAGLLTDRDFVDKLFALIEAARPTES